MAGYNKSSYRWTVSVVVDGSYTVVNVMATTKDSAKMQAAKKAGVDVKYVISATNY